MTSEFIEAPSAEGEGSVVFKTLSERKAEAIAQWRADMNAQRPKIWVYLLICSFAILLLNLSLLIPNLIAQYVVVGLIGAAALYITRRIWIKDRSYLEISKLTPVLDRTNLTGEVNLVRASILAMLASLKNESATQATRVAAVRNVIREVQPILSRGNMTIKTATAQGYPAYPKIDRTEHPSQAGDYISMHLLSIEGSFRVLCNSSDEDVVLAETIAHIAGRLIPPLRSVEEALAPAPRTKPKLVSTSNPVDASSPTIIDSSWSDAAASSSCDAGSACAT